MMMVLVVCVGWLDFYKGSKDVPTDDKASNLDDGQTVPDGGTFAIYE